MAVGAGLQAQFVQATPRPRLSLAVATDVAPPVEELPAHVDAGSLGPAGRDAAGT